MRRSLAAGIAIAIALGIACGDLQTAPDSGGVTPDASPEATSPVADAAPSPDADADAEPAPLCGDASIYCEDFTDKATLGDLDASAVAEANGGVAELVGTVGQPDRAFSARGTGTKGVVAQVRIGRGAPPRHLTMSYTVVIDSAVRANFPGFEFAQPASSTWYVYTYFDGSRLSIGEFQSSYSGLDVGPLTSGRHRVTFRIDLDNKKAYGSIDGSPEVMLDITVPSSIPTYTLQYGFSTPDWGADGGSFTFDDVVVEAR